MWLSLIVIVVFSFFLPHNLPLTILSYSLMIWLVIKKEQKSGFWYDQHIWPVIAGNMGIFKHVFAGQPFLKVVMGNTLNIQSTVDLQAELWMLKDIIHVLFTVFMLISNKGVQKPTLAAIRKKNPSGNNNLHNRQHKFSFKIIFRLEMHTYWSWKRWRSCTS